MKDDNTIQAKQSHCFKASQKNGIFIVFNVLEPCRREKKYSLLTNKCTYTNEYIQCTHTHARQSIFLCKIYSYKANISIVTVWNNALKKGKKHRKKITRKMQVLYGFHSHFEHMLFRYSLPRLKV